MKFTHWHRRKIYAVALLTFVVIVIACLPGIGYQITNGDLTTGEAVTGGPLGSGTGEGGPGGGPGPGEGGPGSHGHGHTVNRLFNGYIQVEFNPALYPISFLMGNENVLRKFRGAAEFWDYEGEQLKEAVTLGTLFIELIRNLPYFIAASLLVTVLTVRLAKTSAIRRLMPKSKTQGISYT